MHATLPNVEDVFPGVEKSLEIFKELLEGLSKTDALIWCFRINHILGEFNSNIEKQQRIAELFFTEEQIRQMASNLVTTKAATTLLARWVCIFCENKETDGTTFNDPEIRQTFAKALLIANQYWLENSGMNRLADEEPIEVKRRKMLCAFRQNAAGSESRLQPPINGIAKGYQMFVNPAYFAEKHANFAQEFESIAHLTIEDYYTCFSYLNSGQGPDIVDGKKLIDQEQAIESVPDDFKPVFRQFFDIESQDVEELTRTFWGDFDPHTITDISDTPGFNDTPLRSKPIFKIHDGRMIVMDPVLLYAKTVDGPMFTLLKTGQYNAKSLIGEFGNAFEKYAQEYLGKIYPISNCYHYPLIDSNNEELADAYYLHDNDLVLFEMKASFLPQDKVVNNNNDEYIKLLQERYVWDTNKNQPKGVTQLANSIHKIAQTGNGRDLADLSSVQRIFPVLLVHDELIDATMHPHFLNNEFLQKLSPTQQVDNFIVVGNLLVAPLTLMTIEDLESISFILKRGLSIIDLLNNYTDAFPERLQSLHNYYASVDFDLKVCQILATQGIANIEQTKNRLFPSL